MRYFPGAKPTKCSMGADEGDDRAGPGRGRGGAWEALTPKEVTQATGAVE